MAHHTAAAGFRRGEAGEDDDFGLVSAAVDVCAARAMAIFAAVLSILEQRSVRRVGKILLVNVRVAAFACVRANKFGARSGVGEMLVVRLLRRRSRRWERGGRTQEERRRKGEASEPFPCRGAKVCC